LSQKCDVILILVDHFKQNRIFVLKALECQLALLLSYEANGFEKVLNARFALKVLFDCFVSYGFVIYLEVVEKLIHINVVDLAVIN